MHGVNVWRSLPLRRLEGIHASCSIYEGYYCWQGAVPFAGAQTIFPPFGTFSPSPDEQGRLLKIPKYKIHNPSKGEGRPAIHKELRVGREGGREKMILTFLNQREKEASCLTCAHDKRDKFPDDRSAQLQTCRTQDKSIFFL